MELVCSTAVALCVCVYVCWVSFQLWCLCGCWAIAGLGSGMTLTREECTEGVGVAEHVLAKIVSQKLVLARLI